LQLRADVNILETSLEPIIGQPANLKLEVRHQHTASNCQPGYHFQTLNSPSGVGNVKPPLGVPTLLLCAVNISLVFSSPGTTALVPRKRPRSESEGFLDLLSSHFTPGDGRLSFPQGAQKSDDSTRRRWPIKEGFIGDASIPLLNYANDGISTLSKHACDEELFTDLLGSTAGDDSEDSIDESHAFSSQASTLFLSQDNPSEVSSESEFSLQTSTMTSLVDGAFRNLICAKPIRVAPGIRTETSNLGARLADVVPSVFSPGYAGSVAVRAPFVPTIARFLTSFLRKGRSSSVSAEKDHLIRQSLDMQLADSLNRTHEGEDEEIKLKEVVKKHLWMTMTNLLRDPQTSRRLKPLQPFLGHDAAQSDSFFDIEDILIGHTEAEKPLGNDTLEDESGTWVRPIVGEPGRHDEMLDFDEDDEADDYERDLFEAYEERLMNGVNSGDGYGLEPVSDDVNVVTKHRSASDEHRSSPMLEEQGETQQPEPAEQFLSTPAIHVLDAPPTVLQEDTPTSSNTGNDETWSNLLDEGPDTVYETRPRASLLLEDDWEPDIEQWEFDAEQGSDEMLF
jgi:hypothetical protein